MDPLMERGMEDPPLPKYELAVTWYELILSPEKFHLHLKKLSEDNNGEKNVYKSILFSAHSQVCNFIFMHMCLCMYVKKQFLQRGSSCTLYILPVNCSLYTVSSQMVI